MPYTHLIQTADLELHLHDPNWVIVDCRFELLKPGAGFEAYQQAHIPGAVYANLDQDLSGPKAPHLGRHPLPEPEALRAAFSRMGIGPGKQVVAYDAAGGSFADRLWWLLRFYGHTDAAVLDGGFPKWTAENRPVSSGVEHNQPVVFTGQPHPEMVLSDEEIDQIRQDPAWLLVDARSPERFRGESEPIDPVAGHIPGAVNRFHARNLTPQGVLKSPQQLRLEFDELRGEIDPEHVVVYCGSGVTSIHHLLAMEAAGLPGGKLYVGSWSQWIRDPNRPIARDKE